MSAMTIAKREARKAREATERRDLAVCEAYSEGQSLRVIAEAVGLSHTAIAKIVARA